MKSFEQLEPIAEAVVFAHDPATNAKLPAAPEAAELEQIAALATAAMTVTEPVPERLRTRLAAAGLQFCSHRPEIRLRAVGSAPAAARRSGPGSFLLGVAALGLVWLGFSLADSGPAAASLVEQRAQLLREPSSQRIDWSAGPSPLSGEVEGEVVWSDELQQGFLTFRGLPPLDSERRFQLWIVDGERPGSDPVDGGLFAIADAANESVVPIRATLAVRKAAAFVVTVEDKDGVVVSKQEHVVATAGL